MQILHQDAILTSIGLFPVCDPFLTILDDFVINDG